MESHHRDVGGQLFVCATELLEDTREIAIAGQHPSLKPARALVLTRRLRCVSRDVNALMDAIAAIAAAGNAAVSRSHNRRRRPRRDDNGPNTGP